MTKDELAKEVAEKSNITQTEASSIIDAFTTEIKEELSRGGKVNIAGFGSFVLSKHGPQNVPSFKSSENFKKTVK